MLSLVILPDLRLIPFPELPVKTIDAVRPEP